MWAKRIFYFPLNASIQTSNKKKRKHARNNHSHQVIKHQHPSSYFIASICGLYIMSVVNENQTDVDAGRENLRIPSSGLGSIPATSADSKLQQQPICRLQSDTRPISAQTRCAYKYCEKIRCSTIGTISASCPSDHHSKLNILYISTQTSSSWGTTEG